MVDYEQWIMANVDADGWGLCKFYSGYMAMSFPELTRVCGRYVDEEGEHRHFWCRTKDGTIIDPTAGQFEPGGTYVEDHVSQLDYEDLAELVLDTPLFEDLEPWVKQRCELWFRMVENGLTDARPGNSAGHAAPAELGLKGLVN